MRFLRVSAHGVEMNVRKTAIVEAGCFLTGDAGCSNCAVNARGDLTLADLLCTSQGGCFSWEVQGLVDALCQAAERLAPPVATSTCVAYKNAFAIVNYRHNSSCE